MANIETSMSFTSTTQGGDKLQKAITDINPDAAGDKLVGFAQKLNALTTNTYTGATKIVKQELSSVTKTDPGLEWYTNTGGVYAKEVSWESQTTKSDGLDMHTFKLNSDARPYIKLNTTAVGAAAVYSQYHTSYALITAMPEFAENIGPADGFYKTKADADATPPVAWNGSGDIVIAVDETDTYAAAEIVIHVTFKTA